MISEVKMKLFNSEEWHYFKNKKLNNLKGPKWNKLKVRDEIIGEVKLK